MKNSLFIALYFEIVDVSNVTTYLTADEIMKVLGISGFPTNDSLCFQLSNGIQATV